MNPHARSHAQPSQYSGLQGCSHGHVLSRRPSPYFTDWRRRSPGLDHSPVQTPYGLSPTVEISPVVATSPAELPASQSRDIGHDQSIEGVVRKDMPTDLSKLDLMIKELQRHRDQELQKQHQTLKSPQESRPASKSSGRTIEAMDRSKPPMINHMQPDPSIWQKIASQQSDDQLLPSQIASIEKLVDEVDSPSHPLNLNPISEEKHWSASYHPVPSMSRRLNSSSDGAFSAPFGKHRHTGSHASHGSQASSASCMSRLHTPESSPMFRRTEHPFASSSMIPEVPYTGLTAGPDDEAGKRQAIFRRETGMLDTGLARSPINRYFLNTLGHESLSSPIIHDYSQQYLAKPPTAPRAFHSMEHRPSQLSQLNQRAAPGQFRPMQAVLEPDLREHLIQKEAISGTPEDDDTDGKFSSRYYGMHTEGNASADHLSDDQNCALWLRNLPPDVTYKELLDSIRGIGRIWCTFINTPDFIAHNTAAAKVVFFGPVAAKQFLNHVETAFPTIRGFRIKADYNRIKYGEKALAGNASRVLIITGAAFFVNPVSLSKFFTDKFIFQTDEIIELIKLDGRAVVEFRFGSYRCQAQMGKMALDRVRPEGLEMVEFGEDPCETGNSFISYRTATERIQRIGVSMSL